MNDKTQILLVDAESECVRRDHRFEFVGHEAILRVLAFRRWQFPVIQAHGELRREQLVKPRRLANRGHVHDPDAGGVAQHVAQRGVLHRLVDGALHVEAEIRARESGDRHMRRLHAELPRDVGAHFSGRRRREREDRWAAKSSCHGTQREIVGAEVVAPLADAVRFVDDEQADGARQQSFEEFTILEALRREIEHFAGAVGHALRERARFPVGQVRVHGKRVDAKRREFVLLVLHQGDERTHDDGESREHQRGELIDEGFAAAGGHDDKCVLSLENGADRLPLALLKIAMTEALDEQPARLGPKCWRHRLSQKQEPDRSQTMLIGKIG